MTVHTDGKPTVSSGGDPPPRELAHLRPTARGDKRATELGSPDAGDWRAGDEAGRLAVPTRAAYDEFRIQYAGGGHSMALTEDRARKYAAEKGGHVERRTVTSWERCDDEEEGSL